MFWKFEKCNKKFIKKLLLYKYKYWVKYKARYILYFVLFINFSRSLFFVCCSQWRETFSTNKALMETGNKIAHSWARRSAGDGLVIWYSVIWSAAVKNHTRFIAWWEVDCNFLGEFLVGGTSGGDLGGKVVASTDGRIGLVEVHLNLCIKAKLFCCIHNSG